MNNKDFLIIRKDILPECFSQILKAKQLVENENKSISYACNECNISRSTFYKYKDNIFEPSETFGKKVIISLKVENEAGVLSIILNNIALYNGNIMTINQDIPIHNLAYITLMIDISSLTVSIYDLIRTLKSLQKIKDVNLIACE